MSQMTTGGIDRRQPTLGCRELLIGARPRRRKTEVVGAPPDGNYASLLTKTTNSSKVLAVVIVRSVRLLQSQSYSQKAAFSLAPNHLFAMQVNCN